MAHILSPTEFDKLEHKLRHAKPGDVIPNDALESLCLTVAHLAAMLPPEAPIDRLVNV